MCVFRSDLAFEAELLGSLVHPHIIKLRGISYGGAAGFEQGPSGYFLIIDRLDETLDQRVKRWHGSFSREASNRRSFSDTVLTFFTKQSNIAKQGNIADMEGLEEQLSVG